MGDNTKKTLDESQKLLVNETLELKAQIQKEAILAVMSGSASRGNQAPVRAVVSAANHKPQ